MITKPYRYFSIVLLAFLGACGKQTVLLTEVPIIPTDVSSPTSLPTSTLLPATDIPTPLPTPLPTQPIIPIFTPDAIQVERWQEYQTALAKNIFADIPPEEVLCEWEILGYSGSDVYVWAVCKGNLSSASLPAVIHLESEGAVLSVERSKNWSRDIPRLFPPDVIEKFSHYHAGRAGELIEHIDWRRTHPEEPPLIVLSVTPLLTQPTIPIITPDAIQVERWREYETELAKVVLAANPEIGNDPAIYKNALCEWDILGQSGQEIYVYGVCVGVTAKATGI